MPQLIETNVLPRAQHFQKAARRVPEQLDDHRTRPAVLGVLSKETMRSQRPETEPRQDKVVLSRVFGNFFPPEARSACPSCPASWPPSPCMPSGTWATAVTSRVYVAVSTILRVLSEVAVEAIDVYTSAQSICCKRNFEATESGVEPRSRERFELGRWVKTSSWASHQSHEPFLAEVAVMIYLLETSASFLDRSCILRSCGAVFLVKGVQVGL